MQASGSVVKNPPAGAGNTRQILGPGGSHMPQSGWAHVPQLLFLFSEAPETINYWSHLPQLLKPKIPRARAWQQEKPPQWEACTPQLESGPWSPKLEKAHTVTKTQHSQK